MKILGALDYKTASSLMLLVGFIGLEVFFEGRLISGKESQSGTTPKPPKFEHCLCRPCSRSYSPRVAMVIPKYEWFNMMPEPQPTHVYYDVLYEIVEIFVKVLIRSILMTIFMSVLKLYEQKHKQISRLTKEASRISIKLASGVMAIGIAESLFTFLSATFSQRLQVLLYKVFVQRSMKLALKGYFKKFVTILSSEVNRLTLQAYIDKIIEWVIFYKERLRRRLRISQNYSKLRMAYKFGITRSLRNRMLSLGAQQQTGGEAEAKSLNTQDFKGYFRSPLLPNTQAFEVDKNKSLNLTNHTIVCQRKASAN